MNYDNRLYKNSMGQKLITYLKVQFIPLVVLLIMVILAGILSKTFFSLANLKNLIVQVSLSMIVSMGMLCVILTGGIDLSVGSLVALAGVLVAGLMRTMSLAMSIIITIAVVTAAGGLNGILVSKVKVAPFIVTLGMMEFARGCAYWYSQSSSISWRGLNGADVMRTIGSGTVSGIPVPAIIWVVIAIVMSIVLRSTVFGRVLYCIGGNEEAVRLSGLNLTIWKALPYLILGMCSAIGGIVLTARLGIGSVLSGEGLEVDCIAATVIGGASLSGGKGSVSGVVIGVFILGIISNLLDLMNVAQYPQMMLKGVIVVIAVILSSLKIRAKQVKQTA